MTLILVWLLGSPLGRIVSGVALCVAIVLGARLWLAAHDASIYSTGKSAGAAIERQAWEKVRREELAKQAAQKAADQARIDQIEADYLALQERLNQERAEAALEEAIRKEQADQKPAIPKSIARALNGVR